MLKFILIQPHPNIYGARARVCEWWPTFLVSTCASVTNQASTLSHKTCSPLAWRKNFMSWKTNWVQSSRAPVVVPETPVFSPAYSPILCLVPFLFLNSAPSSHTTEVHMDRNPRSPSVSCVYPHVVPLCGCSLDLCCAHSQAGFASRLRAVLEEVCGSVSPKSQKREICIQFYSIHLQKVHSGLCKHPLDALESSPGGMEWLEEAQSRVHYISELRAWHFVPGFKRPTVQLS